ncbi:2-dehydropantoate 2-reductase [Methylacidimicrobium tartarophylax]|uniref:2-dehydropantoate 2-reductase n=1 Tax=Methylacidimicrobium tartarophylax TaxID=1041768 RepID=A0A5E6MCK7_9BACT|nr:2-dehydropantoate 2-reductase [Methylacidimicrobium tartarophylax]VVM07276.1 2-dehydropantoate 2-reductase [Methylacidimicrobium tartarophylax]
MKIGVVGAGAVGAYYGSLLARAGSEVTFLLRSDWEAVIRRGYWIQEQGKETFQLYPVRGFRRTEEMGPCDLVLIALKATAREALRELLPPLLQPQTVLVALQNGLGNEEWLSDVFPNHPIIGGIVFGCLTRTAPGRVENAGFGKIELGAYRGAREAFLREVALQFERAGVPCSVVESLEAARWRKLAWNIPFNGISVAGGGCDVEEILRDAELSRLATGLMEEVAAVARSRELPFPEDWTKRMMADTMRMGRYRPSTLVDFLAGRSIEVEAIWGEPLRRAQKLGVPTPRLQALYALLRALDRRSGAVPKLH